MSTMRIDELDQYLGRSVELKLLSGTRLFGKLIGGLETLGFTTPYALKSRVGAPSESTYVPIVGDDVESIRVFEPPPDEDRRVN